MTRDRPRVVFFGTPPFAAVLLTYLVGQGVEVIGVVTQAPKAKGRSATPIESSVALVAKEIGLPILAPQKASSSDFIQQLAALKGDLFLVVAYGQILKRAVLDLPSLGCFNVHASLLPKYRGAAPMQRCLMNGEAETGVTLMWMNERMDEGDIVHMASLPIGPEMTFGELEDALCDLAKEQLVQFFKDAERGQISRVAQNHRLATYAPKIEPNERKVDWQRPAREVHNLIRGLSPRPAAFCEAEMSAGVRRRLKILRSQIWERAGAGQPGQVLDASKQLVVSCGDGALKILELQPEGKRVMSAQEFLRGSLITSFC